MENPDLAWEPIFTRLGGLPHLTGPPRPAPLEDLQKTLGGEPVVTLTIGSHSLEAYVFGYGYEEEAGEEGGLTIWLDNRDSRFDDLATDFPDPKRGAETAPSPGVGHPCPERSLS